MYRFTNGCDWTNRFVEVKEVGFEGLRPVTPEISALFPNKPVFKSAMTRNYLYEVDWTSTASGVNKFTAVQWGQGNATFASTLLAAKAQNLRIIIQLNFNGKGGTWSTPDLSFSYTEQTIVATGNSSGATTIGVNATSLAVPAGSVLCFCRGGSFVGRFYVKTAANSGATSITTWGLQSAVNSGDTIAVIRAGAYIGTISCSTTSLSTYDNNNVAIAVNATGFNISINDTLLVYRGGTIITTTTVQTRVAAGATSLSVSALGATINSGDFCNIPDAPTATEPYGYRCPNPTDASANTDAALAMLAYVLNDPTILYPPELVIVEEWNEPDQRVFGGCGFPGTSGTYGYGWGFFSYPVKYLQAIRVPTVKAAFPNLTYLASSFSYGDGTALLDSARNENFLTTGLPADEETGTFDDYWNDFSGWNKHTYSSTKDGSKANCALRVYTDIKTTQNNIASSLLASLSSRPWYMTEVGIRPNMHTASMPNSDRYNGEMLLVTHDVCRAMGFVLWADYCYNFRDTSYQLTASVGETIGATSVRLTGSAGVSIPVGTVLYWGSTGTKTTTTALVNGGDTSISVSAIAANITAGHKTWYALRSSNQFFHMVPDMISRNSLFIGAANAYGKTDKFWVFAERFATVTLPAAVPIPES